MMGKKVRKLYVEYFEDCIKNGMLDYKDGLIGALDGGYYGAVVEHTYWELYDPDDMAVESYRQATTQAFELWREYGSQVIMFDKDAEIAIGKTEQSGEFSEMQVCESFPYTVAYLMFNHNRLYDGAFIVIDKDDGVLMDMELPKISKVCEIAGIRGGMSSATDIDEQVYNTEYVRNLCMYTAAINADINMVYKPTADKRALGNPKKRRSSATVTEVGFRIGSSLREYGRSVSRGDGSGATVRPHVRRAHWHRFWTGPMGGDRKLVTKWLHPCLVGVGEVQTTLHKVI